MLHLFLEFCLDNIFFMSSTWAEILSLKCHICRFLRTSESRKNFGISCTSLWGWKIVVGGSTSSCCYWSSNCHIWWSKSEGFSGCRSISELLYCSIGHTEIAGKLSTRTQDIHCKRNGSSLHNLIVIMYIYRNSPVSSNKPSLSSKMSKEPLSQVDAFHVGTHCQLKSCNVCLSPINRSLLTW